MQWSVKFDGLRDIIKTDGAIEWWWAMRPQCGAGAWSINFLVLVTIQGGPKGKPLPNDKS